VFCGGPRARFATILLMLVCGVAYADSINGFSDRSALRAASGGLPLHQYAGRVTGISLFWGSSLGIGSRPTALPIRYLIPEEDSLQLRTSSTFDRTIDLVVYLYRNVVMGKQRKLRSSAEACKKGEPEGRCLSDNRK